MSPERAEAYGLYAQANMAYDNRANGAFSLHPRPSPKHAVGSGVASSGIPFQQAAAQVRRCV